MLVRLCTLALVAISTPAQTAPEPSAQAVSTTPGIKAALRGPGTVVFTTPDDSCISADIPDAMACAFRERSFRSPARGKRPLNKHHIENLSRHFKISPEVFFDL